MSFDDLLVRAAAAVLVLCAGWLLLVLLAVAVEGLSHGRLRPARWTGAPEWLRRPLLAAVVAVVGAGALATPATADSDTSSATNGSGASGAMLAGLQLPDRPVGGVAAPPPPLVTVQPGDSLWRIAHRLSPDADPPAISAAVAALHRHNRDVIGDDPDLIHPGQRLRVPADLDDQETT